MSEEPPVLVVIGGLPATGKSTIADHLARLVGAPYLRVDRIEQAIVAYSSLEHPIGAAGYAVAYALAGEQLTLGLDVIVECVNPIALTRDGWAGTAADANAAILRATDVAGLVKPTWEDVLRREYEPWSRPHVIIDSADTPPDQAARHIATKLGAARQEWSSA
jgi:hypothetical protein